MSEEKQKEVARVDRYLLFVGCANSECDLDFHDHLVGWECLAASSDDLDQLYEEVLKIPDRFWWHVVDLVGMRVVARKAKDEVLH